MIHILHLEDNPLDARLILEKLRDDALEVDVRLVATKRSFEEALEEGPYDLILADYYLPGFDGLSALQMVKDRGMSTPVILISGKLGEEAAVESLHRGAVDYILKDYLHRLGPAVRRALEEHERFLRTRAIEQELIKQAQLFHTAEEIGQLGAFEWNINTGELYWSEGLFQIFGEDKELIHPTFDLFISHIHPDDRQWLQEKLQHSIESRTDYHSEYRIYRTDQSTRFQRTRISLREDPATGHLTMIGICLDITESKLAGELIEKSEEKYRTLVEQATDGILVADSSLIIKEVNQSALEILDTAEPDRLVGQSLESLLCPQDLKRNPLDFASIQSGIPVTEVRHLTTFSGNQKYLEITSKRIPGDLIQTVFRDVSDREVARRELEVLNQHLDDRVKKATQEAMQNEERYRLISENSSDLITQSDSSGLLSYVSPSVLDMLGFEANFCLGKYFSQWLPIEDRPSWQAQLTAVSSLQHPSFTMQHRMQQADGSLMWVETVCRGICNAYGQLTAIQTASRNIHARKQAEEDARKALLKERELNELRSHFVSMASHQFRTPLTVISSNVQLMELLKIDQLDPRIKPILRRITHETARLTDLMNDVLILGKLNAKRLKVNPEWVDAEQFVQLILDTHFSQQDDHRIVELSISYPLVPVWMDPGLTEHVLINLITNAFKYSPRRPNPEMRIEQTADHFIITLKDSGIGVPEEDRDNLFQSFYRGNNTTEFAGTGLGLVIAKEFIELQGGEIGYQPAEGGGSLFWVKLPIGRRGFETV